VNETREEGCYCYGFLASLYDQRGEWILTVTELVGFDLAQPMKPLCIAESLALREEVSMDG